MFTILKRKYQGQERTLMKPAFGVSDWVIPKLIFEPRDNINQISLAPNKDPAQHRSKARDQFFLLVDLQIFWGVGEHFNSIFFYFIGRLLMSFVSLKNIFEVLTVYF